MVAAELQALRLATERNAAAQQRMEAAQRAIERRIEGFTTDATHIGKTVQQSEGWEQDHTQGILDCLKTSEILVSSTLGQLLPQLPESFDEAVALELEARAEDKVRQPRVKRPRRAQSTTVDSEWHWQREAGKVKGEEQEVQLGLGWVLRKLREVLPGVSWRERDCSVSGISGHGEKIDYGFFMGEEKFITQLLTMVKVEYSFRNEAARTRALGQLVARGETVFRMQPGRTHVVGATFARDSVDVIVMHLDGRVWHTNHSSFSMGQQCDGLVWLLRLLLATPAAMGFQPTLPPAMPALTSGHTIRNMRMVFLTAVHPLQWEKMIQQVQRQQCGPRVCSRQRLCPWDVRNMLR